MLIDSKATPIPIVEKAYGIHVAMLADRSLIDNASFILVVRADIPSETCADVSPSRARSVRWSTSATWSNLQLPGIGLLPCRWRRGRFRSMPGRPTTNSTGAAALEAAAELRWLCVPCRRRFSRFEPGLLGHPRVSGDECQR